jgi:hypothetical protein
MEKDILSENDIKPKSNIEKTTCDIVQKNILINDNRLSQKAFNKFIKKISQQRTYQFIDYVVMWSLLQMNLRPDSATPFSKAQFILNIKGTEYYYNTYTENNKGHPYIYLLDLLLKKHGSNYSLLQLAKFMDQEFSSRLVVSKDLDYFLEKHKNEIVRNKVLKRFYIRGDDVLKENERLPKLQFRPLVQKYLKSKNRYKYKKSNYLFTYDKSASFTPQCNFDMDLYKNSIFLIHKEEIKSHIFGMKQKRNAFLAVTDARINNIVPINSTLLFQGSPNTRSAALCTFKNKFKKSNSIWLISSNSRDPGQHLFHLMEYGLTNISSANELDKMLRFSRHLFLKDPTRLILESRRSTKGQLQELLKLNIPIYNSKRLGQIWGYYASSSGGSFVLDDRQEGHLECTSQ